MNAARTGNGAGGVEELLEEQTTIASLVSALPRDPDVLSHGVAFVRFVAKLLACPHDEHARQRIEFRRAVDWTRLPTGAVLNEPAIRCCACGATASEPAPSDPRAWSLPVFVTMLRDEVHRGEVRR